MKYQLAHENSSCVHFEGTYDECVKHLMRIQPHSTNHAIQHEGWYIQKIRYCPFCGSPIDPNTCCTCNESHETHDPDHDTYDPDQGDE